MAENKMHKSALVLSLVAVAALFGVGLLFDWTAALAVVLVELLLWLGYQLAHEKLSVDRLHMERERQALDTEWEAFERTRQIRNTMFDARIAMREEAQRYWPAAGPDKGGNDA